MDAALVLDHSLAVANAHYNMGKGVIAAERHNKRMAQKIESTAARADAVFRKFCRGGFTPTAAGICSTHPT